MRISRGRIIVAIALTASAQGLATAVAAPGGGTFTRITTPAAKVVERLPASGASFAVSGSTSSDVTSVDIDCITNSTTTASTVTALATNVPVSSERFHATATISGGTTLLTCRLRAIPSGEATSGYLGAYSGPVVYPYFVHAAINGGTTYGVSAFDTEGTGFALVGDAGQCSDALGTLTQPDVAVHPSFGRCAFGVAAFDDALVTATRTGVEVDGKNAYLPFSVENFLNGTEALSLSVPAVKYSSTHSPDGDLTVTESAPLVRCSGSNLYPPTMVSCPSLVSTGVTFLRTATVFRKGHQIKIRDRFTGVDVSAHTVSIHYLDQVDAPSRGAVGFSYPGHSAKFGTAAPGTTITGLGSGAGTLLARSDLDAAGDEPTADTLGFTWSRPPSSVAFGAVTASDFRLAYTLRVAAHGAGFVGFALSEASLTSAVSKLANSAAADMVTPPSITSPRLHARVGSTSTTVKGRLVAGANGLPATVTINGHAARITKTSVTTARYSVTFAESTGKHRITAVAKDSAGNTARTSITATFD